MSGINGLRPLLDGCLRSGGWSPVTILSPYQFEYKCADAVREAVGSLGQLCLTIQCDNCNDKGLLSQLASKLVGGRATPRKESVYQAVTDLLQRNPNGTLCFASTGPMNSKLRRLLSQLMFLSNQDKLQWRFVFIDSDRQDLNRLSTQLKTPHHIRWCQMSQVWSELSCKAVLAEQAQPQSLRNYAQNMRKSAKRVINYSTSLLFNLTKK